MFLYTYAGIRIIDKQIKMEDRHMSSVTRITRSKGVMNMEQDTKHATRTRQVARQVEKKTKKFGVFIPGAYLIFFHQYRGFI